MLQAALRDKIVAACDAEMAHKGAGMGLSFPAFFATKNHGPGLSPPAASWWLHTHRLAHFEKAVKIKQWVLST